jgi:D-serine deaminase-like pyridoxal phosphate-dependent protein
MPAFMLANSQAVPSPALLFGLEAIRSNLQHLLALAGSPDRLRPHMKTHKTKEITRLYLDHGITRHKCATLMEAKVLAECGAPDVLVAYPVVGPNVRLICGLAKQFSSTRFSVLVEHAAAVEALNTEARHQRTELGLYLDVNVGQDRTGLSAEAAVELANQLPSSPVNLRGLHLYDGHNVAVEQHQREEIVRQTLARGLALRERLGRRNLELVFGGTPGFLAYSQQIHEPDITMSPGTCILHDIGYARKYPELGFQPAAAVLTRCVSRPGPRRATFDVGTKAICSDPPAGQRCVLLGLENAQAVLHNEEHLVLEGDEAATWERGQATYAMPAHICPTVAMYDTALVVERGVIAARWAIAARGRLYE